MEVQYRMVAGYPDYRVGDDGSVWSKRRKPEGHWHKMKPVKTGQYGHRQVTISNDSGPKGLYVHRLLLEAFEGPCPAGMEGVHKDGDYSNNCRSNLCWATPDEKMRYAKERDSLQRGSRHSHAKLTEELVFDARVLYDEGFSVSEIQSKLGLDGVITLGGLETAIVSTGWGHVQKVVRKRGPAFGERMGSAKLTEEKVVVIRHRVAAGEKHRDIAEHMGIHFDSVGKVAAGLLWSHVGGPITPRRKKAKFTVEKAATVYRRVHAGESPRELAKEYGCCVKQIYDIKYGIAWPGCHTAAGG